MRTLERLLHALLLARFGAAPHALRAAGVITVMITAVPAVWRCLWRLRRLHALMPARFGAACHSQLAAGVISVMITAVPAGHPLCVRTGFGLTPAVDPAGARGRRGGHAVEQPAARRVIGASVTQQLREGLCRRPVRGVRRILGGGVAVHGRAC